MLLLGIAPARNGGQGLLKVEGKGSKESFRCRHISQWVYVTGKKKSKKCKKRPALWKKSAKELSKKRSVRFPI